MNYKCLLFDMKTTQNLASSVEKVSTPAETIWSVHGKISVLVISATYTTYYMLPCCCFGALA